MNANNDYLYEFEMTLTDGEAAGQMAGIQIGRPGAAEGQTSYSVAACPAEKQIRVYHLSRGTQTLLLSVDSITTLPDVSYHYQIIQSLRQQKITLLRDGHFLGEASENARVLPLSGNSKASFFTSGTRASFDNLRIYRSRGTSVTVTVGSGRNCDVQWLAADGAPNAKVRSVIVDDQWAFSEVDEKNIRVKYVLPHFRRLAAADTAASAELRLWPNPVSGVLHIDSPVPLKSLEIFDAQGRCVYKALVPEQDIDVTPLKTGIYFVHAVGQNGKVLSATLLKQP